MYVKNLLISICYNKIILLIDATLVNLQTLVNLCAVQDFSEKLVKNL